ncbi:PREDICTED: uncharacterized protein LOC108663859, partial [Theobroma cacao]|uniref:Uncharacterized protein LOC108663859 n=1 Tax=Theobroma cacao TaxID=3641 RepID=A0AB32X3Q2_THECC
MPSYVKFSKDILTKKRKLGQYEIVAFTEECNTIIQNNLPPKLKDLSSFSLPYAIGSSKFFKALCDLSAIVSLMPLSADILAIVRHLYNSVDFLVLEMEEDMEIPLILGRPFLATTSPLINVREGKITFKVGGEESSIFLMQLSILPLQLGALEWMWLMRAR